MDTSAGSLLASVTYIAFGLQFNQEFLTFETQFADFRPRKRVDFGDVLKDQDAHVSHREIEIDLFVIFRRMHFDSIQLHFSSGIKEIEISISWQLSPRMRKVDGAES